MGEEFGTIGTPTSGFRPSQAAFTEAPEEFNAPLVHGDHAPVIGEISVRKHLSREESVLLHDPCVHSPQRRMPHLSVAICSTEKRFLFTCVAAIIIPLDVI
ncbi:MAG: hypothetical protein DMG96_28465 [Acidobacteria bacterium]|nr:MAG: hypothetical protein DMG96_28465 [Acidobacteriota bacterium]